VGSARRKSIALLFGANFFRGFEAHTNPQTNGIFYKKGLLSFLLPKNFSRLNLHRQSGQRKRRRTMRAKQAAQMLSGQSHGKCTTALRHFQKEDTPRHVRQMSSKQIAHDILYFSKECKVG
jgi:hypothetical protein